jgi:DNA-binding NarL/FixJ family response regulator
MIEDVGEVRLALRNSNFTEPRWVLMLTHIDPLTLLRAANAGVEHMVTADQMEPADEFAALLRSFVGSDTKVDTPLSRVSTTLSIAKDDDDRAILQLLATGATNVVIASQIFASEQTVKNRLSRMMKLVGVSNRTEFALLLTGTKMPPPRHFSVTDDIPVSP